MRSSYKRSTGFSLAETLANAGASETATVLCRIIGGTEFVELGDILDERETGRAELGGQEVGLMIFLRGSEGNTECEGLGSVWRDVSGGAELDELGTRSVFRNGGFELFGDICLLTETICSFAVLMASESSFGN